MGEGSGLGGWFDKCMLIEVPSYEPELDDRCQMPVVEWGCGTAFACFMLG